MKNLESYSPRTFFGLSIIVCILFLPLGIAGFLYSRRVNKYYKDSDKYHLAVKSSVKAGQCVTIGIILGLFVWICIYIILFY